MRTAARVDELTEEEYDEIAAWFSGAIHRYRPSYADPAKGGNFDLARYTAHPEEYWSLWKKVRQRYPRVYIEAFSPTAWASGIRTTRRTPTRWIPRNGITSI